MERRQKLPNVKIPKLILVGGGSCSGKTSFSSALSKYLGDTLILSQDNYFIDYSMCSENELDSENFDIPEAFMTNLLVENIKDIIVGRQTKLPLYDFKCHKTGEWKEYNDKPKYIIVEGIMTFNSEELMKMAVVKIFIDTPMDIMLWRRVSRDNVERYFNLSSSLNRYIKFVRPSYIDYVLSRRNLADMVIDGTSDWQMYFESIKQLLKTDEGSE